MLPPPFLTWRLPSPSRSNKHAKTQQPLGNRGTFLDHHLEQLMVILHVAALQRVHEVRDGRILGRTEICMPPCAMTYWNHQDGAWWPARPWLPAAWAWSAAAQPAPPPPTTRTSVV